MNLSRNYAPDEFRNYQKAVNCGEDIRAIIATKTPCKIWLAKYSVSARCHDGSTIGYDGKTYYNIYSQNGGSMIVPIEQITFEKWLLDSLNSDLDITIRLTGDELCQLSS